jgi:hypothetical protein
MAKHRQTGQLTDLLQHRGQLTIINEKGIGGIAPPLAEGTKLRCVDVVPKYQQENAAVHT